MRFAAFRQRDGTTCGPSVAVMAGALLDPAYRSTLTPDHFAEEQVWLHALVNRWWPRTLGTTPMAMARAITLRCGGVVHYRWRLFRGRGDRLTDVLAAVDAGRPVAMLVGRFIPRHWVLVVAVSPRQCRRTDVAQSDVAQLRCYEPSSGEVRSVGLDAVRRGQLTGVGYPRVFAVVLPRRPTRSAPIRTGAPVVGRVTPPPHRPP